MFNMGSLVVAFRPGTEGAIELIILDEGGPVVAEVARVGFTPEQLDRLLTEGRAALWAAMDLLVTE